MFQAMGGLLSPSQRRVTGITLERASLAEEPGAPGRGRREARSTGRKTAPGTEGGLAETLM